MSDTPMTTDDLAAIKRRAKSDFYARAYQDVMALVREVERLQANHVPDGECDLIRQGLPAEDNEGNAGYRAIVKDGHVEIETPCDSGFSCGIADLPYILLCDTQKKDVLRAEVERLQQADAERFAVHEDRPKHNLIAHVPAVGLVQVPVSEMQRGDPRTLRCGPIPPDAADKLEVLVLPCEWVVVKEFLKDIPDQEAMRRLLK